MYTTNKLILFKITEHIQSMHIKLKIGQAYSTQAILAYHIYVYKMSISCF